jgi:hypothetical protein
VLCTQLTASDTDGAPKTGPSGQETANRCFIGGQGKNVRARDKGTREKG